MGIRVVSREATEGVNRSSSVRERASVSERTKAARACDTPSRKSEPPRAAATTETERPFRTRRTSHDNRLAPEAGEVRVGADAGRTGLFRCIRERLSDRRSPGRNPGPQDAFEVSMISVSCNSHQFSQLAAFFIDARAE